MPPAPPPRRVALLGNPNSGKTSLFNALTGLNQRTANYPGVTVEKKMGWLHEGVELLDLPGVYSLSPRSPDEELAVGVLLGRQAGEAPPDAVIVLADAGNLFRHLFLITQILELGVPVVVALNFMDTAEKAGIRVDEKALRGLLGVAVVPTVAHRGSGVAALRLAALEALRLPPPRPVVPWPAALSEMLRELSAVAGPDRRLLARACLDEGGWAEKTWLRAVQQELKEQPAAEVVRRMGEAQARLAEARERLRAAGENAALREAEWRYAWIGGAAETCVTRLPAAPSFTDRLDRLLTHRLAGTLIFTLCMTLVFSSIFLGARPAMEFLGTASDSLGHALTRLLASTPLAGGALESLLVKGILAGVGAIVQFLPQIILLFLFIALLEDCGYLARAAFLTDRLLRGCGLSGQSFIPMLGSFACTVPGLLATRTIANPKDRLATILVAPLMSCSARLVVYSFIIGALVPPDLLWGWVPLQGLLLAALYFLGLLAAACTAWLLKRTLLRGPAPPFVLELPPYLRPTLRNAALRVWEGVASFCARAGTVILFVSVLIWAASYYPRPAEVQERYERAAERAQAELSDREAADRLNELRRVREAEYLRLSFIGRAGAWLEPLVRPLGWDWRVGIGVAASLPAREVIIPTLRIIYELGEGEAESPETEQADLGLKMRAAAWPDGRPVFALPAVLALLVYFALCGHCVATLATIRREAGGWKWAGLAFVFLNLLAYGAAWLVSSAARVWLG